MKNKLLLTFLFSALAAVTFAQTFEIRANEGDEGHLYIQLRETSGTGTPTTSNQVTDIVFQIKWLINLGDVDMGSVICTNYNIVKSGTRSTQGSYYYQEYFADNTPFPFPVDWVQNQWETIAKMEVAGTATGTGTFEVGDDNFVATGVNIGVDLVDYTPTVNGLASNYAFPTTIYTHVWTGGVVSTNDRYNRWERGGNWVDQCGDPVADYPFDTDNAFIPDVSSTTGNFPEVTTDDGWACNDLLIAPGAYVIVPDLTGAADQDYFWINGDAVIEGTMYLSPNAYVSVDGDTYLEAAECLEVQADATGVGSFIDNGTINYGTNGTAKVQTFLSNAAGSGSFYIHLVGPTVDEATYTGTGSGAFLSAFNVAPGSTYAYSWDETVPAVDGWTNQSSNTYEVHTADGIALSTTDATDHTLNMTGSLMTGPITSDPLTFSNNHNELISNPYPSAVDFDALATANSSVVNNKYWMWDPGAGSYISRSAGVGGQQYIQVGQAFFVETNSAGNFTFTNTERAHSTDPFRDVVPNVLMVKASGGDYGFGDELYIRFTEEATSGYDENLETEKWHSWYTDATQFWSVNEDQMEMQINALPLESLNTHMVSVPVSFKCGYDDTYTFSFFDIESFEYGIDIWLEDKQTGEEWQYLNDNPEYTFSATPDDLEDRFIIHFFGPTGLEELQGPTVSIYSYGNYAYIVNDTKEQIKSIRIYNLQGELVINEKVQEQKINKFRVSDRLGYYIVKVVTDENSYLKKILITY